MIQQTKSGVAPILSGNDPSQSGAIAPERRQKSMSQKITVNCRPDSTCEANTLTGQVNIPTADEVRKTPGLAETLVRMVETAITVPVQSKMRAAARKADGIAGDATYATAKKTISKDAVKAAFEACVAFDWTKVGLVQRGPVGKTASLKALAVANDLRKQGKVDAKHVKDAYSKFMDDDYAGVKTILEPLHADIAEVYSPKEEDEKAE